jgi:hypothetical protein
MYFLLFCLVDVSRELLHAVLPEGELVDTVFSHFYTTRCPVYTPDYSAYYINTHTHPHS